MVDARPPLEAALDELLLAAVTGQDTAARRWAADGPGRAYSPPVLSVFVQQFGALFTVEELKASVNRLVREGQLRLETECSPDGLQTAIYLLPVHSGLGSLPSGYS